MMGLVAATALGFALERWRDTPPQGNQTLSVGIGHWLHLFEIGWPSCFAVALALVLIPLRWRKPRPSVSRILRQPGTVASLATVGSMIACLVTTRIGETITKAANQPTPSKVVFGNSWYWSKAVGGISMSVTGVWIALALGGRWSPERSWLDRTGRALGIYWLLVYFMNLFWGVIELWLPYK